MQRGSNSLLEDPEAAAGALAELARTLSLTPYKQPPERESEPTVQASLSLSSQNGIEVDMDGNILLQKSKSKELNSFNQNLQELKFTKDSDLSNLDRRIWVVTTAGMPWRTGTAVNPLMRALYLTRGRPKGSVTLMIPWLFDVEARRKLYGNDNGFEGGQSEQEAWIRDFCRTRANCQAEEENMRIAFWEGTYNSALGSIFPTVDICALIPNEEADVAILEEPEHLNWFRVPKRDVDEATRLGWSHKFKHVVGILHTNYAAYVKLYAMGTSLLTAPALNALSSLTIRAYCHKVIRLSATLPSLDPPKEVTCNVHGVRSEFLDKPQPSDQKQQSTDPPAKVYFIGKMIWAKGFDDVLEVQELFRTTTSAYFPIDIYGDGEDSKGIKRAFFGRKPGDSSTDSSIHDGANSTDASSHGRPAPPSDKNDDLDYLNITPEDLVAEKVFHTRNSLRSQLSSDDDAPASAPGQEKERNADATAADVVADEEKERNAAESNELPQNSAESDSASVQTEQEANSNEKGKPHAHVVPFDVLGELSGKALHTGLETADATLKLMESVVQNMFAPKRSIDEDEKSKSSNHRGIVPARARFNWRRTPLPARFLGVQDHIIVRDIPDQTIFLNMSTTEVLCTTSAEALAMGKFVILPKHPSNEFFYQFPNCLAFESLNDCVVKLQYALSSKPEPLSDKYRHMLSWDGAIERLFTSSGITEEEAAQRIESGMLVEDEKAARFHVESASKSRFVRNLFHKGAKGLGRTLSPVNATSGFVRKLSNSVASTPITMN